MKKLLKKEYPLRLHTSLRWTALFTFCSLCASVLCLVPSCVYIIEENYRDNLSEFIVFTCLSILFLSGLGISIFFIFKKFRIQIAANDKVIIIKHFKEYLELNINNIKSFELLYHHTRMNNEPDDTGSPYDRYSNFGKIRISNADHTFYTVKAHNLDKVADFFAKFPKIVVIKIKDSEWKEF